MNWLFNLILNNSFFEKFIPKQDIDKQFVQEDKLNEKQLARDHYESLNNTH